MTLGPPPSAAGPSHNTLSTSSGAPSQLSPNGALPVSGTSTIQPSSPAPRSVTPVNYHTNQFAVYPQPPSHSYYGASHAAAFPVNPQAGATQSSSQPSSVPYPPQTSYYPQQPAASGTTQSPVGNYSYYGYPPNAWANAWNTTPYQYPSGSSYSYAYAPPQQNTTSPAVTSQPTPVLAPASYVKQKTPSPSPSPPPEYHKDWDAVLRTFLTSIGFSQALRGFEADMIMLNPEWERKKIPSALEGLIRGLSNLGEGKSEEEGFASERPLEDRKLDYVHLENGAAPRSNTSTTKDISRFLAQNRARNDASNRSEFLVTLAGKRRRLNEDGDSEPSTAIPSCARTDAKTQNRDLQMKYDIAKNEDGPLRRTMKAGGSSKADTSIVAAVKSDLGGIASISDCIQDYLSAERHPALEERLHNVEEHLAVRYVPSPPRALLDRLKFLEDHIIHLEREYPPWAALHFNQPNRGWPPPPRATPIIVPSHLTSTAARGPEVPTNTTLTSTADSAENGQAKGKGKLGRHTKSSLHRAVMERLEVQKAMHDLAGEGG